MSQRKYCAAILGGLLFLLIPAYFPSHAFQVAVEPSEVYQGDAFVIKLTGVEKQSQPSAYFNKTQINFSARGNRCFVAIGAVNLKTIPGIYNIRLEIGDKTTEIPLVVKQKRFPEINITVDSRKVFLSPENLRRAEMEREKLKSIFLEVSDRLWEGEFSIPLKNEFSTGFGVRRIINRERVSIHKGLDIRGREGEAIRASNGGRIVLAKELFFGGNTIIINHGQGIYTVYMHLSAFKAGINDMVSKGEIIGFVGSTGRSTGPHLHFGIKVQGISVNPVSVFNLKL